MQLWSRFEFCAAHELKGHAGPCRNLHGHNYTLEVRVEGEVDPTTGMIMDFSDLEAVVRTQALSRLDHSYLNELLEVPSAEHIARWVWRRLAPCLPGLVEVTIYELPSCAVTYRGEHEP